jgi:hypothetical protein
MVVVILAMIVLDFFERINKLTKGYFKFNFQGWQNRLYYLIFWNGCIRYLMESYLAVMMVNLNAMLNQGLTWSSPIYILLSLLSIITVATFAIAPIYMTIYFRNIKEKLKDDSFNLRFQEVVQILNPNSKSASNYFAIFCYRRLVNALLIVLLHDHSSYQVMIYICFNQYVIIANGKANPFKEALSRRIDYFNEVMLLVASYHLFCFTDFVSDAEARLVMGYSLMVVTIFTVAINLFVVAINPV